MIDLLARIFIKDRKGYKDAHTRLRYGMLCGAFGIFLNLLLTAGKLLAGSVSGSIAIIADALNNLTDASSSLVTLLGFRISGRRSDREHPFGHGRSEYIAGLIVAMVIVMVGAELLKTSIKKIVSPSPVEFSYLVIGILIASVAVKLYMLCYNRRIGKLINSAAMKATAVDCLSDSVATTLVLISMVLNHLYGWNIDGYCGVLVALFIMYAGFMTAKDIISPLMGQSPDPAFVARIEELVISKPGITGMHDLIVHDYGPSNRIVSLHAEVPADGDILSLHDTVDNIENELAQELGCLAVIHMDPVFKDDERSNAIRDEISRRLLSIDPGVTLHDFRMVAGPTHSNIIFDVLVPHELKLSDSELKECVAVLVRAIDPSFVAVTHIDRPYDRR